MKRVRRTTESLALAGKPIHTITISYRPWTRKRTNHYTFKAVYGAVWRLRILLKADVTFALSIDGRPIAQRHLTYIVGIIKRAEMWKTWPIDAETYLYVLAAKPIPPRRTT